VESVRPLLVPGVRILTVARRRAYGVHTACNGIRNAAPSLKS
jgi:hypothetical protein